MRNKQIGFIFGILLLILMSACGPATATPTGTISCVQTGCAYPAVCDKNSGQCVIYQTPQAPNTNINNPGPAAGAIAANNPNPIVALPQYKIFKDCSDPNQNLGEVQIYYPGGYKLYFDSSIQNSGTYSYPSGFPPDGMGEGFFGPAGTSFQVQECPVNSTSGSSQCLNINETFGTCPNPTATKPALANPPGIGSGQLVPACNPGVPSIDQVTAFCANPSAKIGGAGFVFHPSGATGNIEANGEAVVEESGADCQWQNNGGPNGPSQAICTGKPGSTMQVMVCSACTLLNSDAVPSSDIICPGGSVPPNSTGNNCPYLVPTPAPNALLPLTTLCPSGTHYDNDQQNCVDNGNGNVVPDTASQMCPPGYPYFDMYTDYCSKIPLNLYNCQYFSVPIGDCSQVKKIPKCTVNANGSITCQ